MSFYQKWKGPINPVIRTHYDTFINIMKKNLGNDQTNRLNYVDQFKPSCFTRGGSFSFLPNIVS